MIWFLLCLHLVTKCIGPLVSWIMMDDGVSIKRSDWHLFVICPLCVNNTLGYTESRHHLSSAIQDSEYSFPQLDVWLFNLFKHLDLLQEVAWPCIYNVKGSCDVIKYSSIDIKCLPSSLPLFNMSIVRSSNQSV